MLLSASKVLAEKLRRRADNGARCSRQISRSSDQLQLRPLFRISEVVAYESFDCIWFALQTKEIGEVSHTKLYKRFNMTISVFSMKQVQNLPSEATILNRTKRKKHLPLSDINDEVARRPKRATFPLPLIWGPAHNQPKSLCPQRVAAFLPSPSFIVSLATVFWMSRSGELCVTSKKRLLGRLHLLVLSFQLCSTYVPFFAAVTPQFFAILAFLFCSYVYLRAFLEFVHGASLLHAWPREPAFLYCNITMITGLFSYRVLLSDLGKRWCRTSAGSHFGRF